ncbi:hypothetical protein GWK26_08595 [haloarchaeon 3A1-DGR]|nr:hypothetical protein GWK26_08595 [haloarchaeon 3A1-DGR]
MSTLQTETSPATVEQLWEDKEGELRLRDAVKKGHRIPTLATVFGFVFLGLVLSRTLDIYATGPTVEKLLATGILILIGYTAFRLLEELDCQLREGQECRYCRRKTARWEADS